MTMNNLWLDGQLTQVEATIHGCPLNEADRNEAKLRLESLLRVVNEHVLESDDNPE